MTNKIFQIEIPHRSKVCAQQGEDFVAGTPYFSILFEEEKQFLRKDFCAACWENSAKLEWSHKIDGYWRSTVSAKKVDPMPKQEKNRDERALDLFRQALASSSVEDCEEAFVLALYLARRKFLYARQERAREKEQITLYEVAETEEMLAVRKMSLTPEQIASIQQRLAVKLRQC